MTPHIIFRTAPFTLTLQSTIVFLSTLNYILLPFDTLTKSFIQQCAWIHFTIYVLTEQFWFWTFLKAETPRLMFLGILMSMSATQTYLQMYHDPWLEAGREQDIFMCIVLDAATNVAILVLASRVSVAQSEKDSILMIAAMGWMFATRAFPIIVSSPRNPLITLFKPSLT